MATDVLDPDSLARVFGDVGTFLEEQSRTREEVLAVDPYADKLQFLLRLRGEMRSSIAIWISLGQRTTNFEAYVLPYPEDERRSEFFEFVLRKNALVYPLAFCLGAEDAIYLAGRSATNQLTHEVVDFYLGSLYRGIEENFELMAHLAFGTPRRSPSP